MELQTALNAVRRAPSILKGIRRADHLAAAGRASGAAGVRLLARASVDSSDQLTAIAAVHALGQVQDPSTEPVLLSLLNQDTLFLREHAAWALAARPPQVEAMPVLTAMVVDGGFPGMLAQRTLEEWSGIAPDHVAAVLTTALAASTDAEARARLVETAGRGPGRRPLQLLRRVAADGGESTPARVAAVEGLGDRRPSATTDAVVRGLTRREDVLGDAARLSMVDLATASRPPAARRAGLAIAQLFLHADIDPDLSHVGAGDNGGIATLLVRLGDALVAATPTPLYGTEPGGPARIERVVTISRGRHDQTLSSLAGLGSGLPGHRFATVPFLGEQVPMPQTWPQRIATQRGLHRVLRAAEPISAFHLRMADVGSLAAAAVARERGIPIVFTLAPDPHGAIHTLDASKALTRGGFGEADQAEHFWFRTRLVQRLAADAARLVLFPRQELERDMLTLLGIDLPAQPAGRYSVVAEGIDLTVIEQSRTQARAAAVSAPAARSTAARSTAARPYASVSAPAALPFADLDALLLSLPRHRRRLPLAISVGRLHPVKGMATLVEAWAGDPALRQRCNLLIVGGDLERPSATEQQQLDQMAAAIPLADAAGQGLLLAGHRPNGTVARWLAAVRYGRPGLAAARGVYVCASLKEEFGIALLEAMATGLLVVAPNSGGPATYVENGSTGFGVDTRDPGALAGALARALDFSTDPEGRLGAERARTMVRKNFTIQAMATSLTTIYRDVAAEEPSMTPEVSDW